MTDSKRMKIITYCEQAISPREYVHPYSSGCKVGGEGWEVAYTNTSVRVFIEDPEIALLVRLML